LALTTLSGPLVLPADVLLVPVAELSPGARRQLTWQDGDVAITRPRLRTPSRLVGAGAAELLREFASPATVVEAVIRHSRASGADPDATLEAAYPLLARLVREGFLVPAAGADAGGIEASCVEGERLAGCTVLCSLQVLEDTEVYQVRTGAGREGALKIERLRETFGGTHDSSLARASRGASDVGDRRAPRVRQGMAARLDREAAVLAHLARGARRGPGTPAAGAGPPGAAEAARVAPRLLAVGSYRERRFLLLEWCEGVDAAKAAGEARERGGEAGCAGILALCRAVARAYARLHRQGVLHCDVHPRNILVAAGGGVRLIDFGLAWWRGAPAGLPPAGRGGVAFYFEPEYAAAVLAGLPPPAASAAGEQYAVAALLYLLAAGAHYLDFSLEREAMLGQIAAGAPRPFAERGGEPWPELEAVLGKALAKNPEERFASLDALAAALEAVPGAAPARRAAATRTPGAAALPPAPIAPAETAAATGAVPSLSAEMRRAGPAAALLAEMLARVRPGGPLWQSGVPEPPFASVQLGAAGVALALYRVALAREDGELLAQADLWAARAAAAESGGGPAAAEAGAAFYNPLLDVTAETVGRASLFHTAPGLRCTEALIAKAMDDRGGAARAAAGFVAAARLPCPNPDLALGRSGLLLGCALLLDALGAGAAGVPAMAAPAAPEASAGPVAPEASAEPVAPAAAETSAGPAGPDLAGLGGLGDDLMAGLWREIDALPPIAECSELPNLGMAHGWAGYLYATLRWCEAAGRAVPAGAAARLEQLAGHAESWGRGARWRWHGQPVAEAHRRGTPAAAHWMAGWCNGSAGMVHLWALAARLADAIDPGAAARGGPGARRWEQLALAAGWHAWEAGDQVESLCCGLAGRAYALLALHRRGAGEEWLARARILADRAAAGSRLARQAPEEPSPSPHSLYRGALGIAVLAADLERPEAAAMPLFGSEEWGGGVC
jgi:hypothetical protein